MKKSNLIIFSVLSFLLAVAGCGDNSDTNENNRGSTAEGTQTVVRETVTVAYLPITHSLAVLESAEETIRNQLNDFKVELVKFGSWPELLDALNTGRVDGAIVLVELAMKAREHGIPIKVVALGHTDGNVLIGANDIQDFANVKGKTLAIPHRQSSHHILIQEALEKNGLTAGDVKLTELAPTEMPSALASNQVGGYCVAEPFGAVAVQHNLGKVLYSSEELWPDSVCCGLVLTEKFIKEHNLLAHNFVKHYKEAGKKLNDKAEALNIARKYLKQRDEVLELSLKWIKFDNLELTRDRYESLISKVVKYGLSNNPPQYEDFVADDF